jgi:hypothetical protein
MSDGSSRPGQRLGIELHAPSLARYEIANALTRKTAHGEVAEEDLGSVWAELDALPIQ